jgi:hypothetical protein
MSLHLTEDVLEADLSGVDAKLVFNPQSPSGELELILP